MGVHARVQADLDVLGKGVGRHGQDGDGLAQGIFPCADGPGGLQAVHHGHLHVHQNGVVLPGLHALEGLHQLLAVGIDGAGGPVHVQDGLQDLGV